MIGKNTCDCLNKQLCSENQFLNQTLSFKSSVFGCCVQEANEISNLRNLISNLPGYIIALVSCTKYPNTKLLNASISQTVDFLQHSRI